MDAGEVYAGIMLSSNDTPTGLSFHLETILPRRARLASKQLRITHT